MTVQVERDFAPAWGVTTCAVLPALFNPWAEGPYDYLGVLKAPFSLAKGGHAILQRASRSRERDARRFHVIFDDAVPDWQRRQKLEGWGRTY